MTDLALGEAMALLLAGDEIHVSSGGLHFQYQPAATGEESNFLYVYRIDGRPEETETQAVLSGLAERVRTRIGQRQGFSYIGQDKNRRTVLIFYWPATGPIYSGA